MIQLDHILIWSNNRGAEIDLFRDAGFTSIISGTHNGQGTSGKYIFFLNTYIEILYISDTKLAKKQLSKFAKNYQLRADWRDNDSSPFGFGLKAKPFDKHILPFNSSEYKADWINGEGILMSDLNHINNLPLIFVVPPHMEFPNYNSLQEMMHDDKPQSFKDNHIHKNETLKLTSCEVLVNNNLKSKDMLFSSLKGLKTTWGKEHLLTLTFDDNNRNKTLNLKPDLPLIIQY